MTFSEKNCNTCGQTCAIKYHGCINWIPINDGELLIPISVLDKIRADIEEMKMEDNSHNICFKIHNDVVESVLKIIDKYKAESKEEIINILERYELKHNKTIIEADKAESEGET